LLPSFFHLQNIIFNSLLLQIKIFVDFIRSLAFLPLLIDIRCKLEILRLSNYLVDVMRIQDVIRNVVGVRLGLSEPLFFWSVVDLHLYVLLLRNNLDLLGMSGLHYTFLANIVVI